MQTELPAGTPAAEHAPINWVTTIVFTATPLAAVILVPWYGIVHGYSAAAWLIALACLWAGGISITAGYHRLWSHRAYNAHWSVRLFFMLFGAMALQNSILIWASQHRTHHRFVDDWDKDPYSARRGFWFSHMGWILRDYPSGRNDFSNARDLERDPIVMFQHRYYLPLALSMNIAFPLLLGWAVGEVWGVFILAGLLRLVREPPFHVVHQFACAHVGLRSPTRTRTRRATTPRSPSSRTARVITTSTTSSRTTTATACGGGSGIRPSGSSPALSWVRLAGNLKRVPDLQIQRAQLAMQFKRVEQALAKRRTSDEQVERLKARVAAEYASFRKAVDEWSKVREEWVADRKQRLLQRWEETSFRLRLKQIELDLAMQRRRLRAMSKAYV